MESGHQLAKVLELKAPTPAPPPKERGISQKRLVNKLNYINFQDGTILINLRHTRFNRTLTLHARPHPCLGGRLECTWTRPTNIARALQTHEFEDILIPDQLAPWRVVPEVLEINEKGATFLLPESGNQIGTRRVRRKTCEDITVDLFQNSAGFHGKLMDFTPISFRVEISLSHPQNFYWLNPELPVQINLKKGSDLIFSGECQIIKQDFAQSIRALILKPSKNEFPRYPKKFWRASRIRLTPSPNIYFSHPITNQKINLKVHDISATGLMIEEEEEAATLLPGMIIQDLEICFSNYFDLNCNAQVVYSHKTELRPGVVKCRCGIAILDMSVQDHVTLVSMLNQAKDNNAYMCNKVDMDQLFSFFFETGFIYPEKYHNIYNHKKVFKETYKKLYTKAPAIARHFIYQDNSGIHGHMSMLRFYENTWLAHHHAASNFGRIKNAGVHVLNQINNFSNESHPLTSIHLNFMLSYFRPENKFPEKTFGGVERYIKNKKACSIDTFAYLNIRISDLNSKISTDSLEISEISSDDLREMQAFYENDSGGLLISALDLELGLLEQSDLINEYKKLGFSRKRSLLSFKMQGVLKSVIMVNQSDIGLNMSDLTNCIKIIVIDKTDITNEIFYSTIKKVFEIYSLSDMAVLTYPHNSLVQIGIDNGKLYNMWILNMQFSDKYMEFFDKFTKKINKPLRGNHVDLQQ